MVGYDVIFGGHDCNECDKCGDCAPCKMYVSQPSSVVQWDVKQKPFLLRRVL